MISKLNRIENPIPRQFNSTEPNQPIILVATITLFIVSIFGFFGNLIVLILFPKIRPKKANFAKIHFQLLWHVALASLLNCTVAVPMLLLDILLEKEQHYIPCSIYKLVTVGCTSIVCFCFTLLAFERYLATNSARCLHNYAASHYKRFIGNRFILAIFWILTWSIQCVSLLRVQYPSEYLACFNAVSMYIISFTY